MLIRPVSVVAPIAIASKAITTRERRRDSERSTIRTYIRRRLAPELSTAMQHLRGPQGEQQPDRGDRPDQDHAQHEHGDDWDDDRGERDG